MSDEILKQILGKLDNIERAVLETAETVNRIEKTQERHESIIETLSMRSIEQESALKRLR